MGMVAISLLDRQYDRIFLTMDHTQCQSCCEGLCWCVEVTHNHIAASYYDDPDCVSVHPGKEQWHFPPCAQLYCANIFRFKYNMRSGYLDYCLKGFGNLSVTHWIPLVVFIDWSKWCASTGDILLKLCRTAPYDWNCTRPCIDCFTYPNWFSLDGILLCCEHKSGKVGNRTGVWVGSFVLVMGYSNV